MAAAVFVVSAGTGAVIASAGTQPQVEVGSSGTATELTKRLPIARKAGGNARSVITIPPARMPSLQPGDTIEASGEVEVSVTCLEPLPKCQGKIYHYSPKIQGRFVLAKGARQARGAAIYPISDWKRMTCSQRLPNRNHHCVLSIPRTSDVVPAAEKLPCAPKSCRVNLVVSAYSRQAKKGNVVVVGVDEDNGSIGQDKGMINVTVFRPQRIPGQIERATGRVINSLPVDDSKGKKMVVQSLRLDGLQAGEQLLVDASMIGRVKHLGYNVLLQSQLVLSEKRTSVRRNGVPAKILDGNGVFSRLNGFNCTRGHSGHPDPCKIRKPAVIEIVRDAVKRPLEGEGPRVPIYLNLVVAATAVYGREQRHGDSVRIRPGGYISVERFSPRYSPRD